MTDYTRHPITFGADTLLDAVSGRPHSLEAERAVARALVYRFLSAAFRYPDSEALASRDQLMRAVPAALTLLAEPGDYRLTDRFIAVKLAADRITPDELERRYVGLFGHAVGSSCPPYGAEYCASGERLQQAHTLSDLAVFYGAFGVGISELVHERADHVSIECEFAAFLCLKEAHALDHHEDGLLDVCLAAQRRFLKDHLGRWLPAFTRLLEIEAGDGFHTALAAMARDWVDDNCRRVGVEPGDPRVELRLPAGEPEDCSRCPLAGAGAVPLAPTEV